jgi:type I restriction enzyme S subunit
MEPLGDVLLSIQAGISPDVQDIRATPGEWAVLKVSAVQAEGLKSSENKAVSDPSLFNPNIEVQHEDLLITRANTDDLIGIACIARNPPSRLMLCDKTLRLIVNPDKAIPDYVCHALAWETVRNDIRTKASGTSGSMKNISQESIRTLKIPLPGLDVQLRIAEILDAVDEDIRLAGLELNKQRTLSEAATQHTVKMLSDGAHGFVPDFYSIDSGLTLGPHRATLAEKAPYLRVANVQRGSINLDDIASIGVQVAERDRYALRAGDLLVVEGNADPDQIGRCAQVTNGAAGLLYQNHLFRLRSSMVVPEFGLAYFNSHSIRRYWRANSATSSGLYTINSKMLASMPFPLVSRERQEGLAQLLRSSADTAAAASKEAGRLRLVKKGLMDDLLTGRVRVDDLAD